MKILSGIGASPGIAVGRAVIWQRRKPKVYARTLTDADVKIEIARFRSAVSKVLAQLRELRERIVRDIGQREAEIFVAQANIVEDSSFLSDVEKVIQLEKVSAELAVQRTTEKLISSFREQQFSERIVADLSDVNDRLISVLAGQDFAAFPDLKEDAVIVSLELSPSDAASLDKDRVRGLATERGGVTSHTAILARALGIPASVGVIGLMRYIQTDDLVIVDGTEGTVVVEPDSATVEKFEQSRRESLAVTRELSTLKELPAETVDGRRVLMLGNIGAPEEVPLALDFGAEGVGLFRTEFSYLRGNRAPIAEELLKAYKGAVLQMEGRKIVLRTLDIGGDKPLPYIAMSKESNPFLGWRGIRISLQWSDLLKTQLEAMLRASAFGNLSIMFPMVSTLDEFRKARSAVEEVKKELREHSISFKEDIEIGIMVETPAAAVVADILAKEVDFFSIGTNDLTQYVLAADRTSEKVSYLFDGLDPAVLRLVKNVIESGHREGIKVAMCGELAADPVATPILVGLGLDEFSMSPAGIPVVKRVIRSLSYSTAKQVAIEALTKPTAKEVRRFGRSALEKVL